MVQRFSRPWPVRTDLDIKAKRRLSVGESEKAPVSSREGRGG